MAKISLAFTFTFTLASLILSVSGHIKPLMSPRTVSELQTLTFTEMSKILKNKEQLAPKTLEFKAIFAICEQYLTNLKTLHKFGGFASKLGVSKELDNAIVAAKESVIRESDEKTSLKLNESYVKMTKGFSQIQEKIQKIAEKHQFKANDEISDQEICEINISLEYFRKSVDEFVCSIGEIRGNGGKLGFGGQRRVNAGKRKVNAGKRKRRSLAELEMLEDMYEKLTRRFGTLMGRRLQSIRRKLGEAYNNGGGEIDAAGKIKVAGGNGIRSKKHLHYNIFV